MNEWILSEKQECPICKKFDPLLRQSYWRRMGMHHPSADIDDGGATRRRMEQLLADNPEMSREDAFFEAVMESAERKLETA